MNTEDDYDDDYKGDYKDFKAGRAAAAAGIAAAGNDRNGEFLVGYYAEKHGIKRVRSTVLAALHMAAVEFCKCDSETSSKIVDEYSALSDEAIRAAFWAMSNDFRDEFVEGVMGHQALGMITRVVE